MHEWCLWVRLGCEGFIAGFTQYTKPEPHPAGAPRWGPRRTGSLHNMLKRFVHAMYKPVVVLNGCRSEVLWLPYPLTIVGYNALYLNHNLPSPCPCAVGMLVGMVWSPVASSLLLMDMQDSDIDLSALQDSWVWIWAWLDRHPCAAASLVVAEVSVCISD